MLVIISALVSSHHLRLAYGLGLVDLASQSHLRRVALAMGLELRVGVHPTLRPPQKKIGFPDKQNYASIRL